MHKIWAARDDDSDLTLVAAMRRVSSRRDVEARISDEQREFDDRRFSSRGT